MLDLQYFLLREHERCIELLEQYDTVGVDWNEARLADGVRRHYSGNFWWARADYYLRLDPNIGTTSDCGFALQAGCTLKFFVSGRKKSMCLDALKCEKSNGSDLRWA